MHMKQMLPCWSFANSLDVAVEELNEEDQNLKSELEMLVARLHVCTFNDRLSSQVVLIKSLYRNPTAISIFLHSTPSKIL